MAFRSFGRLGVRRDGYTINVDLNMHFGVLATTTAVEMTHNRYSEPAMILARIVKDIRKVIHVSISAFKDPRLTSCSFDSTVHQVDC